MFDWKKHVRNFARARGYDFVKAPNLHTFLAAHAVEAVYDVGANDGGYGRYLRRWGYRGEIVSFEPTPSTFARLALATASDPKWTALDLALGATAGCLDINVSRDDRFSSFKPLATDALAFDPAAAVVDSVKVDVRRLDELMANLTPKRRQRFLKLDVQGFEREVLDGAGDTLAGFVGVQLELPVEQLYDGVWSLEEAIADMRRRGFVVAQMTPTNPSHQHPASAFEFDTIFRRNAGVVDRRRNAWIAGASR